MNITRALVAVLGAMFIGASSAPATFDLPRPSGPHGVGTTSWHVTDESRRETLAPAVAREVEVLAWYPTSARAGAAAPYLREGLDEVRGFARLLRGETRAFDHLANFHAHALVDAVPENHRKLPVLVFSHGFGGFASGYTALLEDLASHGYAVLSIVHPYEAGAATLADGRIVSFVDGNGRPRQPYLDVVNEWTREDQTMAAVTSAVGEEQRRLLGEYLSGLRQTTVALTRWVDDTRAVLDGLSSLPRESSAGRLAARLDMNRLGVFGHSMGGVVAGQFCLDDRRCRGGLNLDGIPQYGNMIDRQLSCPFLMVYSARPGRLGASDAIYRRSATRYYRVDVAKTGHLDFSDMILWGGPLRDRGALGAIPPDRAIAITRSVVREYFDEALLGRRSALLAGRSLPPEVTIRYRPDASK